MIARGDVWLADLNPVIGHEQMGTRPVLIISADAFNNSPAEMVIIMPITSKNKGIYSHVEINLKVKSYIKTEDIRAISVERLTKRIDKIDEQALLEVEKKMVYILGL